MFKLSPLQCIKVFSVLVLLTFFVLVAREISKPSCNCDNDSKTAPLTDVTHPNRQVVQKTKCESVEDTTREWERSWNFTGFDNETGTADGRFIIPNYVHFIKFQHATFSFVHMVCILAALKNQRPEKLFIHTDLEEFQGDYWRVLLETPGFKEVSAVAYNTSIHQHNVESAAVCVGHAPSCP